LPEPDLFYPEETEGPFSLRDRGNWITAVRQTEDKRFQEIEVEVGRSDEDEGQHVDQADEVEESWEGAQRKVHGRI